MGDVGASATPTGPLATGGAAKASPAKPSVPSAVEHLRRFFEVAVRADARVDECSSRRWQSLTFFGFIHTANIWVDCVASDPLLAQAISQAPGAELDIPGCIVADVQITTGPTDVPTYGGCYFAAEVLAVDDEPAVANGETPKDPQESNQ